MNGRIAKKVRKLAHREYIDLFRLLLDLPFRERFKLALTLIFRRQF
jgi:hypothetical protein